MSNKLFLIIGFFWKSILQSFLIFLSLLFLPNKNFISVVLCVLVWVLIFELFTSPVSPELRRWFSLILRTSLWVAIPLLIYSWLGAYGLLGAILIILILVGYIIFSNWKLYDYTTSWGAKKLFKGSKEEFDLGKVKNG